MAAIPVKRSPDGYVAQRMVPDGTRPRGPWVLAAYDPDRGLYVELFTDDDVADWPDLKE